MMHENRFIRKVAILGSGVMGAQIAALFASANIPTYLFDLPAKEGSPNAAVEASIARLLKLKPAPLMDNDQLTTIKAANYEEHLAKLGECDLIIEAISERLDWKEALYQKIAPYINVNTILASNTSGLSINTLASVLPAHLRSRFCGVHFFNPPRYMKLVEIIPAVHTETAVTDFLEAFLVSTLGKGVIRAKDTPNFIANRIGVFAMLAVFHHADAFGLTLDEVDALTGPLIGRPKTASYRLADVVGLDTLAHVIKTMHDQLVNDPWREYYALPTWMQQLITQGVLGQKTEKGIYQKIGKAIKIFDPKLGDYREVTQGVADEIMTILKIKNPQEKFAALYESTHPQAQFLWATFRDLFIYSAYFLGDIANNVRDVDLALRWGFGWKQGIFETWQAANWQVITQFIEIDLNEKVALANVSLPSWVRELKKGPYSAEGAYAPAQHEFVKRSTLPVYKRQYYPEAVLGEVPAASETVFETDAIRAWTMGDNILIASFKTKANTINMAVLDGLLEVIKMAEADYKGLVLWQSQGEHFSYGADLTLVLQAVEQNKFEIIEEVLQKFQAVSMALRYAYVPTVAAVRGMVLGGGCELTMHCTRVVAAAETYLGLVEAGVGLLSAGGGTKEFVRRAALNAKHEDIDKYIADAFNTIAMAKTSSSAYEALKLGYLQVTDTIVFNPDEILYVAKQQINALSEAGYRPPLSGLFEVAGISGIANRRLMLTNMQEGHFISEHDETVGINIAHVLCGGEIDKGSRVDEAWLLKLERDHFIALTKQTKTQERIMHTLKTGKPLRN